MNGAPVGDRFRVNSVTKDLQSESAVSGLDNGNFVVTWSSIDEDTDGSGIIGRRFDASGAPIGGDFIVNTGKLEKATDEALTSVIGAFKERFVKENADAVAA